MSNVVSKTMTKFLFVIVTLGFAISMYQIYQSGGGTLDDVSKSTHENIPGPVKVGSEFLNEYETDQVTGAVEKSIPEQQADKQVEIDEELQIHSEEEPDIMVHYLAIQATATPGSSKLEKRVFEVPGGWSLVSTQFLNKKGRVRTLKKNNHVILEAHAISRGPYSRAVAYANLEIIVEKMKSE